MRTKPTQLPSFQELLDLFTNEAPRRVPKEKEHVHYVDFTTFLALLRSYDLPISVFDNDIRFEDLKNAKLFHEVSSMFDNLVDNILRTQDDPVRQTLFNNLYDYLSESDTIEQADLIFVFGSKSTLRTEKAIKLYKAGYATRILISGKSPFYERDKIKFSEAEILARYALRHGIPKDALFMEKESITIPDNVKRSLNLLEQDSIPHQTIILVNSPFSQRRGWAHFSKMSEEGTKLIRINTDTTSKQFSREEWYKNEEGVKVIMKEFFGLRINSMTNTS